MHHYKDNLEPDFKYYHFDEDEDELFLEKLRQYISNKGFIGFRSFDELEPGYNTILIQKKTLGKPYLVYGKFLGLQNSQALLEVKVKGLISLITKKRILKFKSVDDVEIFGSSRSFDSWELITDYLLEP